MRRGGFKAMMMVGLTLGAAGSLAGCRGGGEATATERLWVSTVPTNPKARLTAFVTVRASERASDERYLGAFFHGSLYRGSHDVFEWKTTGKNRARIELLQDKRRINLTFETCTPSRGFDHCLMVHGDPTGTVRYQSRKRWVVRRPGRKRDVAAGLVTQALLELADDDAELAEILDAAEAPAE